MLEKRIARLNEMVAGVEKEVEARTMGIALTPEEKFEIFGPNYSQEYETEAEQRWGEDSQWVQSRERTAKLDKRDDCSYAMHRGLADMYLADARFTTNYEDVAPGLATWLRDAIHANAERHGAVDK